MYRTLTVLVLSAALSACASDFADSDNPNRPVEVPTAYLITQAERELVDRCVGEGFDGIGTFGLHYVQHLSQTENTEVTRYDDVSTSFYPFYTGGLMDLETVIELNTGDATRARASVFGNNGNQVALARILKAWTYLSMTDFWGDIPYSEALMGVEIAQPAYDSQEDIYRGVVAELIEAGDAIVDERIQGDIIYYGDMEAWRLFANSLVLRAGIRVADVAPELGREWVRSALDRGVFRSNFDNAQLVYAFNGEFANNTFFTQMQTRTDYAISEPLVDFLDQRGDPRVAVYAQPTEESLFNGDPEIVGMPYGMKKGQAGDLGIFDVSFPGLSYVGYEAPAILLTYSEVLFNQAEAAARGWIDGDAEQLYGEAVRASFNQAKIYSNRVITEYLEQESVAYDPDNFRKSIGEQKWIALYFQGMEAWSEWRRLGYPELQPAPEGIQVQTIPTRRGYPVGELKHNPDNYRSALQRQFGAEVDALDGRVWWDVD